MNRHDALKKFRGWGVEASLFVEKNQSGMRRDHVAVHRCDDPHSSLIHKEEMYVNRFIGRFDQEITDEEFLEECLWACAEYRKT